MIKDGERVFSVSTWQHISSEQEKETIVVTGYWARIEVFSVEKETNKVIGWDAVLETGITESMEEISKVANIESASQMELLKKHFIVKEADIK